MKPRPLVFAVLTSLVLGIAQTYLLVLVWGHLAVNNPLRVWLLDAGLRGEALRAVLCPIDFLINVVLSLPVAFVLLSLRPARPLLFLAIAVAPYFFLLNFHLIGSGTLAQYWRSFAFGWVQELLALPAAALLLHFIIGPATRNPVSQGDAPSAST
jgi:hypothetical protein